ncbi:hypothetical protein AB3M81_08250 [Aeromicrobium sp. 179-A 4D2 NHS]
MAEKFTLLPRPWWARKNAIVWALAYLLAGFVGLGLLSKNNFTGIAGILFDIACWVFALSALASYFIAHASQRAYDEWKAERARQLDDDITAVVSADIYPMRIAEILLERGRAGMWVRDDGTGNEAEFIYSFHRGVSTVKKVAWVRQFPE